MQRVLVTGGSRGLGLAICERLLHDGFSVITASRTVSPELSALLRANPKRLEYYATDFADPKSSAKLAQSAGLLDGLSGFVANAAIGSEGLLTFMSERAIRQCV